MRRPRLTRRAEDEAMGLGVYAVPAPDGPRPRTSTARELRRVCRRTVRAIRGAFDPLTECHQRPAEPGADSPDRPRSVRHTHDSIRDIDPVLVKLALGNEDPLLRRE